MIKIWRKGIKGAVHFTSPLLEACGGMTRISGDQGTEMLATYREINSLTALASGAAYGTVCKRCRRNMENMIEASTVISARQPSHSNGEMPSLEEIADEAPMPLPVIPVFVCLVSADMARTWCDQATASVKSTIDMHDATCPSCVSLVQAELAAADMDKPTHIVTWTFEGNTFDSLHASAEFANNKADKVRADGGQNVRVAQIDTATDASEILTREAWLIKAVEMLSKIFEAQGFTVPPVRISVGWPGGKSKKGLHSTIGQCWYSAKDGVPQIFISPKLTDTAEILATIMHELVHAVDGGKSQHKAGFKRIAVLVGLEGKMTATHAGETLRKVFPAILETLGKYDHAELDPGTLIARKQTNNHLKMECGDCGYVARATSKQNKDKGLPQHCGEDMYEA